jgi:hypothetical protein
VVVAGIDEEAGRQAVPLIASRGPGATIGAGVSEQMAVDMMVEQALSEFDRVAASVSVGGSACAAATGWSLWWVRAHTRSRQSRGWRAMLIN